MVKACEQCGKQIEIASVGRPKRFCGQTCRKAANRAIKTAAFPAQMMAARRWVRRQGKRPLTSAGWYASSTNSRTWDTFEAVQSSVKGDGFGFMLGGGIGCIDLDHCINDGVVAGWAREILDRCSPTFVEVSASGTGLHVFGLLAEGPGRGQHGSDGVEFYSAGRFIAVTGDRFDGSVNVLADLSDVVKTL